MADSSTVKLARPVGLFSLTALAINGIVGASIFVLPATVANIAGVASVFPYLIAWLAALLIGLCFAEISSRFERSGGPYVYAREVFGSVIGFEVGLLFILARLTALAAIVSALTSYLAYFVPAVSYGSSRLITITLVLLVLGGANFFGIRHGIFLLNLLTVGKLFPLLLFIFAGLFFVRHPWNYLLAVPAGASLQKASLLLIFAFTGFEYACVPSEEVINSKRNTPIAMVTAICLTGVMYTLIQIVSLGTLPGLSTDTTPLASAARLFLGPIGGATLTLGAVLSAAGTISAAVLVGSRMMYALAKGGQLPMILGSIHSRYRTPYVSVALFVLFGWGLTFYGNFAGLVAFSAIARLLYYMTTCLAVLVLRARMRSSHAQADFTIAGGAIVPALGVVICVWLLMGISRNQATISGALLLLGVLVYWSCRKSKSHFVDSRNTEWPSGDQ